MTRRRGGRGAADDAGGDGSHDGPSRDLQEMGLKTFSDNGHRRTKWRCDWWRMRGRLPEFSFLFFFSF